MFIRNHTKEDYPIFCKWWEQWGWSAIPYIFIPQNSIVVCDESGPICAVFLYKTDTPIIWAENYISDKKSKLRSEAVEFMIKSIAEHAQALGAMAIMSSVKHKVLASRLECAGFTKTDDGLTNYMMVI